MKRTLQAASLIFFTTLFLSTASRAQEGYEHLSVFAHGSGRTYSVNSIGLNSVGLNPALLDYDHSKRLEIRIFPLSSFGLDAGSGFRNASVLGSVFDLKPDSTGTIPDAKRKEVSNALGFGKLSGRGDAGIFGIAYHTPTSGSIAFTWTTHAALRTDIPQAFLDFFLLAESELLTNIGSYSDFDLQGLWYSEYALSYGKSFFTTTDSGAQLQTLHIGGAIKYVSGIGILKLDRDNYFKFHFDQGGTIADVSFKVLSAYTNNFDPKNVPNRFSFDFLTSSQAGSGIGFDLGVALSMGNTQSGKPPIYIASSVTDIGFISWTDHAQIRHGENQHRVIKLDNSTDKLNQQLTSLQGTLVDTNFTTSLPTMFRLGAKLDLDAIGAKIGSFAPALSAEFAMGLTDMVGSLKDPRLGVGFTMGRNSEESLPLRFGTGFLLEKNATDLTLAVGTTLFHSISIDLATGHLLDLFSSASRIDLAFGISAAF